MMMECYNLQGEVNVACQAISTASELICVVFASCNIVTTDTFQYKLPTEDGIYCMYSIFGEW